MTIFPGTLRSDIVSLGKLKQQDLESRMMKIVFFTEKSARGTTILQQMADAKIPIEAIVIDTGKRSFATLTKKLKSTWKRLGLVETSKLICKKITRKWVPAPREAWRRDDFYQCYAVKVYKVEDFNGMRCEQLLKQIEPDIIILGGARIIRKNIIRIPKIGILNAHPALLPKYRGVDVIPWSIYHGDDVGVTIHFIDEGIDTGGIVARKVIALREGDTIESLMNRANERAGEMMSEAIVQLMETRNIQTMPQSKEAGRQFYRMSLTMRQEVEQRLRQISSKSSRQTM
jgi:methionyl-tRNA formyltransferase